MKQSCSHQKFGGWEYKKHPTKKPTNYKQGLRNLLWTLKVAIDNLIGNIFTLRIEISLLYDKSDKLLTIYDSYNAECAARMIKKKIDPSNISEVYSPTNMMKFNISNNTQKHLL